VTLCSRYETTLEVGRLLAMKKYFIMSVCVGIVFFLNYIGYGLAFWYGAELTSRNEITPGSVFTVSFLYSIGLLMGILD
jgi:ABC transporter transmembrane region.